MHHFATLFRELDETTATNRKLAALVRYFREAPKNDAAWAVWFLCGNRPRRVVPVGLLRQWCSELAQIPEWLFAESYDFVGDLSETIALLLPRPTSSNSESLTEWVEQRLLPLAKLSDEERREAVSRAWCTLDQGQRFVFNKLLTGGFRVGVSQKLVVRALSEFSGIAVDVLALRLMGNWQPTAAQFAALLNPDAADADITRPYPFCLAHALADNSDAAEVDPIEKLGPVSDWSIEWKWDGIRAQLIRRQGQTLIWSRGEELMTERFPEVTAAAAELPDGTVLDGELVGWKNQRVLPFADLQKRIARKTLGKKLLTDVPVRFLAFDVLECNGIDIREQPLSSRLEQLARLFFSRKANARSGEAVPQCAVDLTSHSMCAPPRLRLVDWEQCRTVRSTSRTHGVEGLMLKRLDSVYGTGRIMGLWYKWKVEPFHCDAVLLYAQRGHGRRSGLFTDYTFAAWDGDQLVTFAKAYSGLTNDEIREVDAFIRANTIERFGPVHSVRAELVFELAFEGLQLSNRHKSGIAVRFPRIARWRRDKSIKDADSIEDIRRLAGSQ